MDRLTGTYYDYSSSGTERTVWVANNVNVDTVKAGDVIRYATDTDNFLANFETVFRPGLSNLTHDYKSDTNKGWNDNDVEYRVIHGTIYAADYNNNGDTSELSIIDRVITSGTDDVPTASQTFHVIDGRNRLNDAKYMRFQLNNNTVYSTDISYLDSSTNSFINVEGSDLRPTNVFVYETRGRVRLIYFINH